MSTPTPVRVSAANYLTSTLMRYSPGVFRGFESPIEALFLAGWVIGHGNPTAPCEEWGITWQVAIGDYRVDFLIANPAGRDLIVECDGHQYHGVTAEQRGHDVRRDRYLTARGYAVFRFTGRELWRDLPACLGEVEGFLGDREAA